MNSYELLYICDPRLSEEETTTLKDRITGIIRNGGGEVLSEDDWGVRRMAYIINKIEDGHYILVKFKAEAAFILGFDRQLRLNQAVIRFMITREEE